MRVSFTNYLPLSGMGGGKRAVLIPGVTPEPVAVGGRAAGADYFAIMGTQLLRGRDFDRSDSKGAVVVNETMARQFWGSPDAAMGKVFRMDGIDCRVIGVAENGKYESLQEDPMPFLFVATPPDKRDHGTLLIETATAPTAMAGTIRKAIHDTDPDAFVASLVTLRQNMQLSLFPYRVAAGLFGTIAILGIFLAGVGLYGLVSYSVSRRTHEIGIRVAMGAETADVLVLVFREAVSRLAIGAAIGARRGAGGGTGPQGGALPGECESDRSDWARRRCGGGGCGRVARRLRSRTPGPSRKSDERLAGAVGKHELDSFLSPPLLVDSGQ